MTMQHTILNGLTLHFLVASCLYYVLGAACLARVVWAVPVHWLASRAACGGQPCRLGGTFQSPHANALRRWRIV